MGVQANSLSKTAHEIHLFLPKLQRANEHKRMLIGKVVLLFSFATKNYMGTSTLFQKQGAGTSIK